MEGIKQWTGQHPIVTVIIVVVTMILASNWYSAQNHYEGLVDLHPEYAMQEGEQAMFQMNNQMGDPMPNPGPSYGMDISGVVSDSRSLPQFPDSGLKSQDLMPASNDMRFNQLYPGNDSAQLDGRNFLAGKRALGIDTQSSSLRNASYDIRGAGVSNPQIANISPWWNSTIEYDGNLRTMDIGSAPSYPKPSGPLLG